METEKRLNVLLIDDHPLFTEGLERLLTSFDYIEHCFQANSGKVGLQLLERQPIDYVFLDIEMPGMDGLQVLDHIQELPEEKHPKVVIMSMLRSKSILLRCLKKGIKGYVHKSISVRELHRLFDALRFDNEYFSPDIQRLLVSEASRHFSSPAPLDPDDQLTDMEERVLQLTCQQYTIAEIATELNMSENTVKSHRHKIVQKTGAKNMIGIVVYALEHELVTLYDLENVRR